MRLFLAIDLPREVRGVLRGLQQHIKGGRPVPEENLHLTLAFLGDSVPDEVAEGVHDALVSKTFAAANLELCGIGSFGTASPRAIWIGARPEPWLKQMHGRIANIARRAGCVLPKRRYRPHVTLVRYSAHDSEAAPSLGRLLASSSETTQAEFAPRAFHLYRSYLGHGGSSYEQLASYPLKGS